MFNLNETPIVISVHEDLCIGTEEFRRFLCLHPMGLKLVQVEMTAHQFAYLNRSFLAEFEEMGITPAEREIESEMSAHNVPIKVAEQTRFYFSI